jgi:hypothetical protein
LTLFFIQIVRSHDIQYNDTQPNGLYCRTQPNDAQHYEFNRAVPFALEAKESSSEKGKQILNSEEKIKETTVVSPFYNYMLPNHLVIEKKLQVMRTFLTQFYETGL